LAQGRGIEGSGEFTTISGQESLTGLKINNQARRAHQALVGFFVPKIRKPNLWQSN
jgi:hypothetical protein